MFHGLPSVIFFSFLCFDFTISNHSPEMALWYFLINIPYLKKIMKRLIEKYICKLCPGMNYSAVGHEFEHNE